MFATAYSSGRFIGRHPLCQNGLLCAPRWLCVGLLLIVCVCARAEETNRLTTPEEFKAYAQQTFAAAEKQLQTSPTNSEALLEFARAGFALGEFSQDDDHRAALAERCIKVCREWVALEPNSAAARYYLGMNLGQLARTKSLGALRIVDEMEREFKKARELDEHFSNAGPDRNLGLLYLKAPVFASIGSRSKARLHLQKAVELAPLSPENRLNLIEAYLRWKERADAARELKLLDTLWSQSETNYIGKEWDSSWADWRERRTKAREKLDRD